MYDALLPDEALSIILAFCLVIPPDIFLQFPVEKHSDSHAYQRKKRLSYLLVSKRWNKVAKPPLYTSVVLRKNAHTKAVAAVLQDTPGLGKHIHALRLEGGYGRDFSYIVAVSPNIKHLYLNLELMSSDTIAGLRKSLTTMNPETFYAHQVSLFGLSHNNQIVVELRAIMETCISSRWANLSHVHLCDAFPMSSSMANALRKADTIEELHISTADAKKWLSADVDASLPLVAILKSPDLQIVRCCGMAQKDAVFARLNAIPSLPHAIPLFIFEAGPGEVDDTGRHVPDLLEAATQELLADVAVPVNTAFNVRTPLNWQDLVGPSSIHGRR